MRVVYGLVAVVAGFLALWFTGHESPVWPTYAPLLCLVVYLILGVLALPKGWKSAVWFVPVLFFLAWHFSS